MKIKLLLLVILSVCLSGCLSWDVDEQALANAAAAGAGAAVADAVVDAVTDDDENADGDAEETEEEPEEPRVGYVPDPNDPLNGPQVQQAIRSDDPYYAPVYPNGLEPFQAPTGGIYRPDMGDVFFGDQKASRVGDILTINLNETTTSTKANAATVSKSASATLENPTVLGETLRLDTDLPQQGTDFSGNASRHSL